MNFIIRSMVPARKKLVPLRAGETQATLFRNSI